MSDVVRMPYAVANRTWIEKLVKIGYLPQSAATNPDAIEKAVARLRQESEQWFADLKDEKLPG